MNNEVTIVMYHYVRDLQNSKYPAIKGLEYKYFKEQILYFKNNYTIITMEELIYCSENKKKLPKNALLLTFDDGYKDHYEFVFPFLIDHKLQGSFYIPVKAIKENRVLDVNKIHFILAVEQDTHNILTFIQEELLKYEKLFQLSSFDTYFKKLAIANRFDSKEIIFIKRLLQVELPEKLRLIITDKLFKYIVGVEEDIFSKDLYVTTKQLKIMQDAGMHIGCHGYDHYWWNHMDKKLLEKDINKSLLFFKESGIQMNNWTASYPYGSYNDVAMSILNDYGCILAFTTYVDIADINKHHRLLLPRLDTNDFPKSRNSNVNEWYNKITF